MSTRPSPARYSGAAIFLHWTIALLLAFQLSLGWRLETLHGVPQFLAFQLHKSVGISILLLSLARLAIRLWTPRPAPFPQPRPLSFLAEAVHWGLYVVMIGGPISGWILVSTAKVKVQTMYFGLFPWPHLPLGSGWNEPAEAAHSLIGWLLVGLVVLHVAGALKHHIAREDLIGRMMPRAIRSSGAIGVAAFVAIAALFGAMTLAKIWPLGSTPAPAAPMNEIETVSNDAAPPLNTAAVNEAAAAINEAAPVNSAANEAVTEKTKATAVPWRVGAGGKLGFKADYSGAAVDGTFKRWDADILFSPDDLPGSKVSVTVDLASVDTSDGERDDQLKSSSFFDIAAHPKAVFRSSKITQHGTGYRAAGTLSLHGVSKPVTLDFTLDIRGDETTATGSAQLSRTAFGVGTGEWSDTEAIKDGVTINFSFKAKRQK
ncbi:YceI family protein [Sphingobium nicotianae]|uniref:YceI family protein n=1 Tax=Sphingobium nicotianae TaxID=2782607 RepID=A0A9X1DAR0_9SPHN|nr:YceI family protein [Sphingobium nicotianae]MBT2186536.1 YceI family protein [Sphingobium nicotianae]